MEKKEAMAAARPTAGKALAEKGLAVMEANQSTEEGLSKEAGRKQADGRTLAELNLLDDFLFGAVVGYPEIGERFVRILLKTIFGREFGRLSVTSQKVFYGADTRLHGARLDVYLEPAEAREPDGRATVYDIEPDLKAAGVDRRTLSRRTRFYHGKIAARGLNAGADYDTLKDVVIVMILPYDPFGLGRMVYTVKSKCVEAPEMEYEDGASTLFLYTRGTVGVPSEELRQLLKYMEQTTHENAVNGELREIHGMVEAVKKDSEVGRMRIRMLEEIERQARQITKQELENAKLAETITKQAEENARQAETITKQAEENARQAEENARQAEEITKQELENAKLAEEIRRLQERLAQAETGYK